MRFNRAGVTATAPVFTLFSIFDVSLLPLRDRVRRFATANPPCGELGLVIDSF
jgi:hypothetical protein